ncbi:hypothetical protein QTP70_028226 [Hemibagrus guttatus]|uniref:Protein CEBPZOS n=1 Tax=Hemibagrus guttatus TaxID=175788 RepID=A0AAE0QAW5_9TELE|nr:hypothetical protein QTP70_028226 [Hemibagrus guttatus]
MAPKTMEPVARKIFKGVLFLEVLGVFAAYGLYYRMNTSRDFRCTMNKRFPSVLEGVGTVNHLSPPIPIFCILNTCTH